MIQLFNLKDLIFLMAKLNLLVELFIPNLLLAHFLLQIIMFTLFYLTRIFAVMQALDKLLIDFGQKTTHIWEKLQQMVKDFTNGLNQSKNKALNIFQIKAKKEYQEDGRSRELSSWTILKIHIVRILFKNPFLMFLLIANNNVQKLLKKNIFQNKKAKIELIL